MKFLSIGIIDKNTEGPDCFWYVKVLSAAGFVSLLEKMIFISVTR